MRIWYSRKWGLHYIPTGLLEKIDLFARSVWVGKNESFADNIKRCINVHRIGVFEAHEMQLL